MKTKSLQNRRRRISAPRAAESITRGMRQIEAMIRDGASPSERFTVRTVELPDEPSAFAPHDVRTLRDSLNVSQPVFASLIGISTMLVKAWEQGMRKPSRMARRLMDEIRANPSRWRAKIHHQPIAG